VHDVGLDAVDDRLQIEGGTIPRPEPRDHLDLTPRVVARVSSPDGEVNLVGPPKLRDQVLHEEVGATAGARAIGDLKDPHPVMAPRAPRGVDRFRADRLAPRRVAVYRLQSMIELFSDPQAWIGLLTLTALEIVLGIDNIVFIAILTARLPEEKQPLAYRLGLAGAMVTRVALLLAINWIMGLTAPLFTVLEHEMSGRDLILLVGGLFLIGKSAHEIYEKVEVVDEDGVPTGGVEAGMAGVIVQIMIMDIIFSLDSVITAVGMVKDVEIMIIAVVIAILVMLIFAKRIGDFVNAHPSMKILALAFLLLIGVLLTAEGFGKHIEKGYIYFAMGFALLVELANMRFRKKRPVRPA